MSTKHNIYAINPELEHFNDIKTLLSYMGVMVLPTIVQLYRSGLFYWWSKPENPVKTTDMSQDTDTLNVVSSTPRYGRASISQC